MGRGSAVTRPPRAVAAALAATAVALVAVCLVLAPRALASNRPPSSSGGRPPPSSQLPPRSSLPPPSSLPASTVPPSTLPPPPPSSTLAPRTTTTEAPTTTATAVHRSATATTSTARTSAPTRPVTGHTTTTTVPPVGVASTSGQSGAGGLLAALGAVLAAAAVGAVVFLLLRRRRPGVAPASAAAPAPTAGSGLHQLLDVSRRLAAITTAKEIRRAIVREALGLVPSRAGALVLREGDRLVVGHESEAGVMVPEWLGEGAIARVAETGQPTMQVSSTEPAVRYLPVSLLAVPLVVGGQVAAVLVLLRTGLTPYLPAERDLLAELAPIAGAAMQGAIKASAAVEESLSDPLTGVGNRRRLERDLNEIARAADDGPGAPTSLAILDIDHFKSVNDTHGHPAGDALLRDVAAAVRDAVRPGDGVYRYGGEEFVVVMPATTLDEALEVAERLRATIEERSFDVGAAVTLRATASFGVAVSTDGPADVDGTGLVARADAGLYAAKQGGRNRVCRAPAADAPARP